MNPLTETSGELSRLLDADSSSALTKSEMSDKQRQVLALLGGSTINSNFAALLDEITSPGGKLDGPPPSPFEETVLDEPGPNIEFVRPNGQMYYARDWSGLLDVEVLRKARANDQFALSYGPPGTGKTAMAEAAFGEDLITVVLSGDTEVSDLVGQYMPNPLFGLEQNQAEYVWMDGPLVRAAEEGRPLLLDEIGLGDPKVLSIVYGLMDGRKELVVTANPNRGIVKAQPGFYVIGSTNPNAPGVNLSEALLSRFTVHVEVTTDWVLAITRLKVPEAIVGLSESLNKQVRRGELDWSPQMRELLAFRDLSEIFGEKFAIANLIAACPASDREVVQNRLAKFYGESALAARI